MRILFAADSHLSLSRPAAANRFFRRLKDESANADAVYLLGDLFDLWLGDDDDSPLADQAANAIRRIADSGIAVYFQHGNRDFLLGESFANRAGFSLLPEEFILEADGEKILLMHGDSLCTDDADYQQFRVRARNPSAMQSFLKLPLPIRRSQAAAIAGQSEKEKSAKSADITDVSPAAVVDAFRRYGCATLIHGHTHRPARHRILIDDKECERIVLPHWLGDEGGFAVLEDGNLSADF